jgi:hypothetical protein
MKVDLFHLCIHKQWPEVRKYLSSDDAAEEEKKSYIMHHIMMMGRHVSL